MQTEIIEGNKFIAEFNGWRFEKSELDTITAFFEGEKRWIDDERFLKSLLTSKNGFAYNIDWNKLMPVWYKFRDLKIKGVTDRHYHKQVCASFGNGILNSDITGAWNDAVMAIKWYNSIK